MGLAPREQRESRGAVLLENGAIYEGEWREGTNTREGQGLQIWSDGSLYEGYWLNN